LGGNFIGSAARPGFGESKMSIIGIAQAMGVTTTALEELLAGKASVAVAAKLDSTTQSIQEFLNGGTSIGLAGKIGCTSSQIQELRHALGDKGAIGLLIGLCLPSK
jgi:plasmid maintenance system antidote protein VapI